MTMVKKHSVVTRDSGDNAIIDCAIEADADYIITGDNDLLSRKEYRNIKIISAADFMNIIL
jgi:uncharacterized protein